MIFFYFNLLESFYFNQRIIRDKHSWQILELGTVETHQY